MSARAEAMASMYKGGKTLVEIGQLYGITRERVRQIITKHIGKLAKVGGAAKRKSVRLAKLAAAQDAEYMARFGLTFDEWRELRDLGRKLRGDGARETPTISFAHQRQRAKERGIEWKLTLAEWWDIWQGSGKWEQRGRTKGSYVMCRFGDVGAYEIGNVYIATCSHNCSVQPNHPRRQATSAEVAA